MRMLADCGQPITMETSVKTVFAAVMTIVSVVAVARHLRLEIPASPHIATRRLQ